MVKSFFQTAILLHQLEYCRIEGHVTYSMESGGFLPGFPFCKFHPVLSQCVPNAHDQLMDGPFSWRAVNPFLPLNPLFEETPPNSLQAPTNFDLWPNIHFLLAYMNFFTRQRVFPSPFHHTPGNGQRTDPSLSEMMRVFRHNNNNTGHPRDYPWLAYKNNAIVLI